LKSAVAPDIVLSRRLHGANNGILKRDSQTDYARVLKTVLDRRRAEAT